MSGRTDVLLVAVCAISALAALTDVLAGRIYNWLTVPAFVAGLAAGAYFGGWAGLGQAAAGALAGLALYGWMFWLRVMGGGDVKLLIALGAWGGLAYVQEVAVLGVLLGGVCAAFWLALKGRLPAFLRKIRRFVLTLITPELELELPRADRSLTMPFGVPIAAAAIWSVLAHPVARGGWLPWL